MKNKFGFTIIEVLVVIGIIAILTAIIFPSISEIRKKNRDTERVSDISNIQLGLALYFSHKKEYPSAEDFYDMLLAPKYFPTDSLIGPEGNNTEYIYVPLTKETGVNPKCTYYHLGVKLELPNAQIDDNDDFNSSNNGSIPNNYKWCGGATEGINPNITGEYMYHIRPN